MVQKADTVLDIVSRCKVHERRWQMVTRVARVTAASVAGSFTYKNTNPTPNVRASEFSPRTEHTRLPGC